MGTFQLHYSLIGPLLVDELSWTKMSLCDEWVYAGWMHERENRREMRKNSTNWQVWASISKCLIWVKGVNLIYSQDVVWRWLRYPGEQQVQTSMFELDRAWQSFHFQCLSESLWQRPMEPTGGASFKRWDPRGGSRSWRETVKSGFFLFPQEWCCSDLPLGCIASSHTISQSNGVHQPLSWNLQNCESK